MNETNWIEGKDEDGFPTIDPQDGEGPIILWKNDVRGKEECLQIQKAYERGVRRGRGDRCRVGLETIVKLHRQWIDERQPGAVQVLCEIIEIAQTALGRESGEFAEKAMSQNDSIEHWLL